MKQLKTKSNLSKRRNSIRGLDPDLYIEACVAAKRAHLTIGEWLNQTIKEKLDQHETQ